MSCILLGIDLNNYAIAELQKGDISRAYELLVCSYEHIRRSDNNLRHQEHLNKPQELNQEPACSYCFAWTDCTVPITKKLDEDFSPQADASSMPFLYLKFLTIDTPTGRASVQNRCSCGFAWAIWYNIGIVSAVMAGLKQRMNTTRRQHLLEQALWMFGRAERVAKERRESSEEPSRDWSLLGLSILNNQACVLRDLRMDDQVILQRLVDMGLTLTRTMPILDCSDQQSFLWTIQLLVQDKYAPAA